MADENETLVDGKALSSLRVVDLKQELKKRGLKTNGSKAYLQNLLKVYIESENASNISSTCADDHHNRLQDAQTDEQNELSNTMSSNLDESDNQDDSNVATKEKNESSVDDGSNLVVDDGNGDDKSDKTEEDVDMSEVNDEKRDSNAEFTVFASEESASNSVFQDNNARDNDTTGEALTQTSQQNTNAFKVISDDLNQNNENSPEDVCKKDVTDSSEIKSDNNVERDIASEQENERQLEETETETKIELTSNESVSQLTSTEPVSKIVANNDDNNDDNNDKINEELEKAAQKELAEPTESSSVIEFTEPTEPSEPSELVSKPDIINDNSESQQTITNKLESNDITSNITATSTPETTESTLKTATLTPETAVNKEVRHSWDGREPRPPRKRRWGSTTAQDVHNTNKGISSDQLKELIPDLNTVTASNNTNYNNNSSNNNNNNNNNNSNNFNTITVKVSNKNDMNVNVSSNTNKSQTSITNNENPSKRDIRVVRKSVSVPEENNSDSRKAPPKLNVETKKPHESEVENESKTYATKSMESNIIFIKNLVRPFTLLQLKDELGKTGKIIEQQFWIDKIKSKCYVTYETVAEAVATRQALHGTRWPQSNPKLLCVDFSTKDELDYHLNLENSANKEVVSNKADQNQNNNEKLDILIKTDRDVKIIRENEDINKEKEKVEPDKIKIESRPIREWDREKLVNNDEKERPRAPSKRRPTSPSPKSRPQDVSDLKRRRHDSTKGGERNRVSAEKNETISVQQQEPESPAKLLDDLFKKTTATPSIYWLPLTEEQSVSRDLKRAEIDKKRKEEREARDEQFRKKQDEMLADRRERENDPTIRNERGPNMRSNSPPNRRFNSPPNRRPNMPARRPSPYRRASPRRSPIRRSPPRHPTNPRPSRSPVNRRNSPPRRRR